MNVYIYIYLYIIYLYIYIYRPCYCPFLGIAHFPFLLQGSFSPVSLSCIIRASCIATWSQTISSLISRQFTNLSQFSIPGKIDFGLNLSLYGFYKTFTRFTHRRWICNGCNIYNAFVTCWFDRFVDFLGKISLQAWAVVFEKERSFSTCIFSLF